MPEISHFFGIVIKMFFDDHNPPHFHEEMFPEKHQTIAVNFDGTPGIGLDKVGKILFPLFQGQLIRATIKVCTDPAHSACEGINGLLTFALELEHSQMILMKFEPIAKPFVIPECLYREYGFFKQLEPDSRSESLRE